MILGTEEGVFNLNGGCFFFIQVLPLVDCVRYHTTLKQFIGKTRTGLGIAAQLFSFPSCKLLLNSNYVIKQ